MCKSNYSVNSFRVVDVGNSDLAISIKQAITLILHIKLKRPTLNKQIYYLGSSFVIGIF